MAEPSPPRDRGVAWRGDRGGMRAFLLGLLLVTACGQGGADRLTPAPDASALPLGKADLPLDPGRYASPDGFAPRLTFTLAGEGWQSVHRYDDFFDVGHPEPGKDAPRLAIAFARATQPDAASVLAPLRRPVRDATVLGRTFRYADVVGGEGEVFRNGNLGLYADDGQHLRLYAGDVDGTVLVVAVIVPDGRRWAAENERADAVLATLRIAR